VEVGGGIGEIAHVRLLIIRDRLEHLANDLDTFP
jgi:hypothetical protein